MGPTGRKPFLPSSQIKTRLKPLLGEKTTYISKQIPTLGQKLAKIILMFHFSLGPSTSNNLYLLTGVTEHISYFVHFVS